MWEDQNVFPRVAVGLNERIFARNRHAIIFGVANVSNNDGTTSKPVDITVGVPVAVYEWNMDVDPGWNYEGQWGWSSPTGGGGQYGRTAVEVLLVFMSVTQR